jgi:outer membrane lipoprotein-sorting protein
MIPLLLLLAQLFVPVAPPGDNIRNVRGLVKAMHAAASEAHYNDYTFIQTTIRYEEDGSVRDTMTWYEAVSYPDRFRIDFGDPSRKTAVIYRNDSSYFFREGELVRSRQEYNPFLLLEGGLKCYKLKQVLRRMKTYGYDLGQFREDEWQGKPVFVVGAKNAEDLRSKQVWVEQERLIPIRRIDPQENGSLLEVNYSAFENHDGGWIETRVDFHMDGKLLQVEFYNEIDTRVELRPELFEPGAFGSWHWWKP